MRVLIRHQLIISLALSVILFAPVQFAQTQEAAKIAKIGWLSSGSASASGSASQLTAFRQRLQKLGYVEGKNIAVEYRYAENKHDRLSALADDLVRLRVDAIIAASTTAALAAKNATRTIPVVFFGAGDPVAAGLVDSLARPGENLTGFTTIAPVLAGKRLELLKETIPSLSRVALLWNPKNPASTQEWKESQLSAREVGLELHSMEASSADKFDNAFRDATKAGSTGLAATLDALINSNQKRIADLAIKNRLPAVYPRGDFAESGGMMSYGPDQTEPYRRMASMADKILKGGKPADLPVEQPTKFELVINLKAAKQIGLTIPPNVLARAEKVIK